MQPQPIDSPDRPPAGPATVTNGVLVLAGYGLSIRVERGQLEIRDGIGRDRRAGRIHRATGRLRRLVVLGHTGAITLEAIRWLADVGAGYLQVDQDGRVLAAFGRTGTDRPSLRRAQALAGDSQVGLTITRTLLAEKLHGQAATLRAIGPKARGGTGAIGVIENLADALSMADDIDGLRLIEARAAAAYWAAWADLPVRFARRDVERVPLHWRTFGSRSSPLTGSPRLAANPANALLNYLYALLEAEATLAARIVGLDPGLGVIHADQLNRDSLAADLMEPARPLVDRFVADLLDRRTFSARDFFETREGVCRVTAPLARELAMTSAGWGCHVGRVAEDVARRLEHRPRSPRPLPTPVSGRNRRAVQGRDADSTLPVPPVRTCTGCGSPTSRGRRTCSDACRAEAAAEIIARLRAGGPPMTEDGRRRLGEKSADLIHRAREWQREHGMRPEQEFRDSILPTLADVPIRALARQTGLSLAYCRQIKRGQLVPHPMWWEAFKASADPRGGAA